MAVEKGKVLTAIEAKLKGKSLSKNFKENIASKWADKIDTDEDIDSYIEDREDILLEASSEADRRATEAAQKAKAEKKDDGGTPPADPPSPPVDKQKEDEIPAWAKALLTEVQTLKSEKQAESIQSKALSDERMKNIPKSYLKGRSLPAKEEELEDWVSTTVTDYQEFAKEMKLQSFGNDTPPAGTGAPAGTKPASKAEIDAVGL